MNVLIHNKNVTLTEIEVAEVREEINKLEKYVMGETPATVDVYFEDESGNGTKNGSDQRVGITLMLGGEKLFVEEIDSTHAKAFRLAYGRMKEMLEERHRKKIDRRQDEGLVIK
ncbi:MAG: Sigma 54 modulation protein / S30EA ribosomal protein [bacterium ADurb.Bin400]|nr:MAG: Sigma 54 modulation protein / S30EA ribosomal protein [bacterium ADurb.Bin400]